MLSPLTFTMTVAPLGIFSILKVLAAASMLPGTAKTEAPELAPFKVMVP
jgi:hypothetical protein